MDTSDQRRLRGGAPRSDEVGIGWDRPTSPPQTVPSSGLRSLQSLNTPLPLGEPPSHHLEHIRVYLSQGLCPMTSTRLGTADKHKTCTFEVTHVLGKSFTNI